jgi:AcrR family transcriptional regulator
MNGSKRGKGRRGYHHGNLSEALVEAALDLIAEYGPAGFTFAEVTRAVGVSPAAPYRHFRDRDALMADIARRKVPMSPEDLLEAGVLVYLGGLGFDGPPDPSGGG